MSDAQALEDALYEVLVDAAGDRHTYVSIAEARSAGVPSRWAEGFSHSSKRMIGRDAARDIAHTYATDIATELDRVATADPAKLAESVPRL